MVAWFAITTMALVLLLGVVMDAGHVLAVRAKDAAIAFAAARAGSTAVSQAGLSVGQVVLSPSRAVAVAQATMAASNTSGTVAISARTVTVTVNSLAHIQVIPLLAGGTIPVHATASATANVGA